VFRGVLDSLVRRVDIFVVNKGDDLVDARFKLDVVGSVSETFFLKFLLLSFKNSGNIQFMELLVYIVNAELLEVIT
jgi:hypothetical protein